MATESNTMLSGAGAEDTVFGLSANVAAAIGYIIVPAALVFLLVEEDDNEFLRFNASQAIAAWIALTVLWFGVSILTTILGAIIGSLVSILSLLINLVIAVAALFLAFKAYQQETIELPVLADLARSIDDAL